MTNGIFLACNSLSAMSRGSDSPFSGTSTGAFILLAHKKPNPHTPSQQCAKDGLEEEGESHEIWRARVPRIRARSYLVM